MTRLEAALLDLTSFLVENGIPYMIIGGFANVYWGVERFTKDLDVTIEVDDAGLEALIQRRGAARGSRSLSNAVEEGRLVAKLGSQGVSNG